MENTHTHRYVDTARETLTNVSNLAFFPKDNGVVLQYTTQAGDKVEVELEQGFMQTKAAITYTIYDGPRSRTEQQNTTTACLVTLLKDLNAEAAV